MQSTKAIAMSSSNDNDNVYVYDNHQRLLYNKMDDNSVYLSTNFKADSLKTSQCINN